MMSSGTTSSGEPRSGSGEPFAKPRCRHVQRLRDVSRKCVDALVEAARLLGRLLHRQLGHRREAALELGELHLGRAVARAGGGNERGKSGDEAGDANGRAGEDERVLGEEILDAGQIQGVEEL